MSSHATVDMVAAIDEVHREYLWTVSLIPSLIP